MMRDDIWISTAAGHASNLRPFRHDVAENDAQAFASISERLVLGEPIASTDFPTVVFGHRSARDSAYNLPHLFFAYGYWLVSEPARDILSRFDLGDAVLSPVQVLKKDRQTPVAGTWTCLHFGNFQETIVPAESPRMRETYVREGCKGWIPPSVTKDGDVAVLPAAGDSPAIWKDPRTRDCFFLSGALATALRKGKVDRGFFLNRCRVVVD